jgi:hypothetical protein
LKPHRSLRAICLALFRLTWHPAGGRLIGTGERRKPLSERGRAGFALWQLTEVKAEASAGD